MTPTTPSSSSDCVPFMHYHTATLSQNSMPTLTPSSTHPPPIFHSSSTHPPPIFYPSFIYPPPSSFTPFSSFLTRPPFTHFNPPHSSFIPSFSLISPIFPSPIFPSPILPSLPLTFHSLSSAGDMYLDRQGISHDTMWDFWQNHIALGVIAGVLLVICYVELRLVVLAK